MIIPLDITKHITGKLHMQTGRAFYSKLLNADDETSRFYFRISISQMYNSTAVFLADNTGEYHRHVCEELELALKLRYRKFSSMQDGRSSLYDGDHTEFNTALWAMSDHKALHCSSKEFKEAAPGLIMKFKQCMTTLGDDCASPKDFKRLFDTVFGYHVDKYEQLLAVSYKDDMEVEVDKSTQVNDIQTMVSSSSHKT